MGSFYGNNNITPSGGITPGEVETKITEVKNHIIFSKVEPTGQKAGDIWVILKNFVGEDDNSQNNQNNNG